MMIPIVVSFERRRGSMRARSVDGRCKRRRRPRRHPVFGARRTTFDDNKKTGEKKETRVVSSFPSFSRAIEKKRRYDKKEAKLGKTRNTFFLCILKSKTLRRKEEKPKGVPRGTVGTSDEGFGGLVGYDACLTRRRSSVRLRPEIQLFFCMCVRRQSERENIMQATFKLRAKSA